MDSYTSMICWKTNLFILQYLKTMLKNQLAIKMDYFWTLKSTVLISMLTLGQYHIAWLFEICNKIWNGF